MALVIHQRMTLADLPTDIIQVIIPIVFRHIVRDESKPLQYESISAQNVRLISPRWNALGLEHLITFRPDFPVIKRFCWRVDSALKSTISMRISEKYQEYFGVNNWNLIKKIPIFEWKLYYQVLREHELDVDLTIKLRRNDPGFEDRKRNLHEKIARLLTVQSSKCENIDLQVNANLARSEFISIENIMTGMQIDQLHFLGIKDLRPKTTFILEVINHFKVNNLVLVMIHSETIDNVSFFNEALQLVLTIEITTAQNNDGTDVSDKVLNQIWRDKANWLNSTMPQYIQYMPYSIEFN